MRTFNDGEKKNKNRFLGWTKCEWKCQKYFRFFFFRFQYCAKCIRAYVLIRTWSRLCCIAGYEFGSFIGERRKHLSRRQELCVCVFFFCILHQVECRKCSICLRPVGPISTPFVWPQRCCNAAFLYFARWYDITISCFHEKHEVYIHHDLCIHQTRIKLIFSLMRNPDAKIYERNTSETCDGVFRRVDEMVLRT